MVTVISLTAFTLFGVVRADPEETTETSESEQSETSLSEETSEQTYESSESEVTETSETSETSETFETDETTSETSESSVPEESSDEPEQTEENEESVASGIYGGIDVDGNFDDWDSVVKSDPVNEQVNSCAMVWDGDYVYLMFDEAQQNSASWSGPSHNGNFVIKTDLDEVMIITIGNNGAAGNTVTVTIPSTNTTLTVENGGIAAAFNEAYSSWGQSTLTEIAIPTSALPDYLRTISFGYYLGDMIISNVGNFNPTDPEHDDTPNDGSAIYVDGDYADWNNYPVNTIEYQTAGTDNNYADAKGAIYQDNGTAYVYGVTNNFRDEGAWSYGNQFLEVTVSIGGRSTKMQAVLVNDDGTLDWGASGRDRRYDAGTYHFALFEQSGWGSTSTLDSVSAGDILYGDLYMTVEDYQDKTEFNFDVETLANHLGVSASDGGIIHVQFHRIGNETLDASGASTGPWIVAVTTVIAAGSYYVFTTKRKKQS